MVNKSRCFLIVLCMLSCVLFTGCANFFDAPLKPSTGWFLTSYTVPLTLDVKACDPTAFPIAENENFYFFWPQPRIDIAWNNKCLSPKQIDQGMPLRYAELEVLTIFCCFGRYRVKYY